MNFINEPWELGGSHGEARLKGTRAECREKVVSVALGGGQEPRHRSREVECE